MKKRTFLLLEILIAFVLVAICLIPLVKQPLKLYRSEMKYLERMELERLADWTFTEIKELLLKNEIPWEKLPQRGELTGDFPLPGAAIQIPGCPLKGVKRSFKLKGKGEKTGRHEELYRQIGVEISLNKQIYKFRLPIKKECVE